jgi:hypothetical protein
VTTCQEAEIATDVLFTALGVAWDESQREGVAIGRRGLDDLLGRSTRHGVSRIRIFLRRMD